MSSSIYLKSTLLFALTLTLNLLIKGLIGLVFPLAFVFIYLLLTRQTPLLRRLPLLASLRSLPPGDRAPLAHPRRAPKSRHRHAARPRPPRQASAGPGSISTTSTWRASWANASRTITATPPSGSSGSTPSSGSCPGGPSCPPRFPVSSAAPLAITFPVTLRQREAALTLTLWAGIVLALLHPLQPAGVLLAPRPPRPRPPHRRSPRRRRTQHRPASVLLSHRWLLLPLSLGLVTAVCGFFAITAPRPRARGRSRRRSSATSTGSFTTSPSAISSISPRPLSASSAPRSPPSRSECSSSAQSAISSACAATSASTANLTLAAGMTLVLLAAHSALRPLQPNPRLQAPCGSHPHRASRPHRPLPRPARPASSSTESLPPARPSSSTPGNPSPSSTDALTAPGSAVSSPMPRPSSSTTPASSASGPAPARVFLLTRDASARLRDPAPRPHPRLIRGQRPSSSTTDSQRLHLSRLSTVSCQVDAAKNSERISSQSKRWTS